MCKTSQKKEKKPSPPPPPDCDPSMDFFEGNDISSFGSAPMVIEKLSDIDNSERLTISQTQRYLMYERAHCQLATGCLWDLFVSIPNSLFGILPIVHVINDYAIEPMTPAAYFDLLFERVGLRWMDATRSIFAAIVGFPNSKAIITAPGGTICDSNTLRRRLEILNTDMLTISLHFCINDLKYRQLW